MEQAVKDLNAKINSLQGSIDLSRESEKQREVSNSKIVESLQADLRQVRQSLQSVQDKSMSLENEITNLRTRSQTQQFQSGLNEA